MINEKEIPKHRKKSQKSVKKSSHKHNYEEQSFTELFRYYTKTVSDENRHYYIFINEKCSICEKEKERSESLSHNEYIELVARLPKKE